MTTPHFTTSFSVAQSPEAVFDAINNVRAWWSGVIEGPTDRLGAQFAYRYKNVHRSRQRIIEFIRGQRIVWRVSDILPVFVDGRTDAYGPALLDELDRVSGSRWNELASKWSINTAVLPNDSLQDLAPVLMASADWALVHLDNVSLVFVRRIPQHAALIARYAIDPATWHPPAREPDEGAPAWKRAYGGVGRAWYSAGMARSLLAIDARAPAQLYLERALTQNSELGQVRQMLAPLYRVAGRIAESERLLEGLDPRLRGAADRESGRLLLELERPSEALVPLTRAVEVMPDDVALRVALADVCFQSGELGLAREHYQWVLAKAPRATAEWNKLGGVCERLGDLPAATFAYERSLSVDPSQPLVWNALGTVYAHRGALDRADECFKRALELQPGLEPAQVNLDQLKGLARQPRPSPTDSGPWPGEP